MLKSALLVAKELTIHNALEAHVRDELGINEVSQTKPLQAAWTSGAAFSAGGVLPLLVTLIFANPAHGILSICLHYFFYLF